MHLETEEEIKNDTWEEDKEIKNEQKSLLIILASLVILSTAVVLGIFLFFPFNFQKKSPIIVEENTPDQESSLSESNRYIAQIHQQSDEEKSQSSSEEEFFIEIIPKEDQNQTKEEKYKTEKDNSQAFRKTVPKASQISSGTAIDEIVNNPPISEKNPKTIISNNQKIKPSPLPKEVKSQKQKSTVILKKKLDPVDFFWIQIGSFSEEKLAESAISQLKLEGFEAKKLSFNNGKTTFTRVRLGPYDKKSEADKFLGWIKEIKGFNESYVIKSNR